MVGLIAYAHYGYRLLTRYKAQQHALTARVYFDTLRRFKASSRRFELKKWGSPAMPRFNVLECAAAQKSKLRHRMIQHGTPKHSMPVKHKKHIRQELQSSAPDMRYRNTVEHVAIEIS